MVKEVLSSNFLRYMEGRARGVLIQIVLKLSKESLSLIVHLFFAVIVKNNKVDPNITSIYIIFENA